MDGLCRRVLFMAAPFQQPVMIAITLRFVEQRRTTQKAQPQLRLFLQHQTITNQAGWL
jgi:hypothetical protein